MATFIFDGTANVTAAKTDTVVISANPALFTQAADTSTGSAFTYSNGTALTITGSNFGPNLSSYPNVSLANGTFSTGATTAVATATPNALIFAPTGAAATVDVTNGGAYAGTAAGVRAIFGGLGVADPVDGNDSITIGGKGSFLVYGNAGADTIAQSATQIFDSTSFVTVFGGKGNDSIVLNQANVGAKMVIYGGESDAGTTASTVDLINVANSGTSAGTTIFGGQGAADSTDGNDSITFVGGGNTSIFGNAGADTIATTLDSTAASTVIHGGRDADTITLNVGTATSSSTASVFGDEGGDNITVTNGKGTIVIYGDTAAADTNGGNDTIAFTGQGTTTIYAAGGNDSITVTQSGDTTGNSTLNVFAGNGNDVVTIGGHASDSVGTITTTLGAGSDRFVVDTKNLTILGQNVVVTDFAIGSGNDSISLNTAGTQTQAAIAVGTFQTLQSALDAAANAPGAAAAGNVGVVAYNGSTYVVVNQDTTGGFSASTDLAIKLTGVTDVAGVVASIGTITHT